MGEAGAGSTTWRLSVDLGTTFTSASATGGDGARGTADLVMLDDSPRMPSAVALDDDGTLLTGAAAMRMLARAPDRAERNPKSRVGDPVLLLGGEQVSTVDAVAAVLAKVAADASIRYGGQGPSELVLTHPARWGSVRLSTLREAARRAGLPDPLLVAEPVAAATAALSTAPLAEGDLAAVFDLGGGTLDIALVRRLEHGFELVGAPGGNDRLGGELFDQRLLAHLGERLARHDPSVWENLRFAPDRTWRRAAHELREQARSLKESLSVRSEEVFFVGPPVDVELRLTRDELEVLLDSDVEASVAELDATVARAGFGADDLAQVFLVGGGSRVPLVARRIGEWLGRVPTSWGDPKSVVALGAPDAVADLGGVVPLATRAVSGVPSASSETSVGIDVMGEPDQTIDAAVASPPPERSRRRWAPALVGVGAVVIGLSAVAAFAGRDLDDGRSADSVMVVSGAAVDAVLPDEPSSNDGGGADVGSSGGDAASGGPEVFDIGTPDEGVLVAGDEDEPRELPSLDELSRSEGLRLFRLAFAAGPGSGDDSDDVDSTDELDVLAAGLEPGSPGSGGPTGGDGPLASEPNNMGPISGSEDGSPPVQTTTTVPQSSGPTTTVPQSSTATTTTVPQSTATTTTVPRPTATTTTVPRPTATTTTMPQSTTTVPRPTATTTTVPQSMTAPTPTPTPTPTTTTTPPTTTAPPAPGCAGVVLKNYVGWYRNQAEADLAALGLGHHRQVTASSAYAGSLTYHVVWQSPSAGSCVTPGATTVTLRSWDPVWCDLHPEQCV